MDRHREISFVTIIAKVALLVACAAACGQAWAGSDAIANTYPPIVQGQVNAIVADSLGNHYIVGHFSGTRDFNPLAGNDDKSSAGGSQDVFITRFNADSTYAWTQTFGSSASDQGNAIALSPDGLTVYVGGQVAGADGRIGGAGPVLAASGGSDAFVIALNAQTGAPRNSFGLSSSGMQKIGGTAAENAFGVAVSGTSVYVVGSFNSSDATIGVGGPSAASFGGEDVFIAALDAASGQAKTAFGPNSNGIQRFGGSASDVARGVAVSGTTVYVTGQFFSSDATFPLGSQVATAGLGDAFILAVDAASAAPKVGFGVFSAGVQTFGGNQDDFGAGIAVAGSNVYVTGYFNSPNARFGISGPLLNAPDYTAFVGAVDASTGAAVTAFGSTGTGVQTFGGNGIDQAASIAVNGADILVAGNFQGTGARVGGIGPGINANGTFDAFVFAVAAATGAPKLGFGLNSSAIQTFGGSGADLGSGIAVSNGILYLAGQCPSINAGIGGAGPYDGTGFAGLMLPLNASNGAYTPPAISSLLTAFGTPGSALNYQITAINSPTSYNATNLPPGLTFNSGLISGALPSVGTYNINLTARNIFGAGNAVLVLRVLNDAVAITNPPVVQSGGNGVVGLAIDSNGNRYITGNFGAAADFNPGVGLDARANVASNDVFVTRFNANGSYAWTQTFGGSSTDIPGGIAVSPDGLTVYVTGNFNSPDAKIGGIGPAVSSTASTFDAFVIALDSGTGAAKTSFGLSSSGIQVFGGTNADVGNGITVAGSTVYVTGYFSSADAQIAGAGPSAAAQGVHDAFVIALDSNTGAARTSFGLSSSGIQKFGGSASDQGYGVAVNGSTVYVTGYFLSNDARIGGVGPQVGATGSVDSFVIALDAATGAARTSFGLSSSGIQKFGGATDEFAYNLAVTASTVYAVGYFNSANAAIGGVGPQAASAGSFDAFVIALNSTTGAAQTSFGVASSGIQTFGGTVDDEGLGVAVSGTTLYLTGFFKSTNARIGGAGPTVDAVANADAFALALDAGSGAAKTSFGLSSSGIQKFSGNAEDSSVAAGVNGTTLYVAGRVFSTNAGVGGVGTFNGSGFGGLLLPLDAATGAFALPAPVITSPLTASGAPGAPFNYQITAINSPATFGATNLPAGLTVDAAGLISGTLPAVGVYHIDLSATDAGGNAGTAQLVLLVVDDLIANTYPPIVQGGDLGVFGVAVDTSGNRYVVGQFGSSNDPVDFNPGPGVDAKLGLGGDAFITRFNANGSYAWTQTFGGTTGGEVARAVVVSPDGATVYIAGDFTSDDAKIGGVGHSVDAAGTGAYDTFVIALKTADGSPKAGFGIASSGIQQFGGLNDDTPGGIALSADGQNLYVAGTFNSNDARIFNGAQTVASNSSQDAFVFALDASTGLARTSFGLASTGIQKFGGVSTDVATGVAVAGSAVYVCGYFQSSPARIGVAGPTVASVNAFPDAYVFAVDAASGQAKASFGLASSGVQTFGGTGTDSAGGVVVSGSLVYACGSAESVDARVGAAGPSVVCNNGLFVLALNATTGAAQTSFGLASSGVQVFGGATVSTGFISGIAANGSTVYAAGQFFGTDAAIGAAGPQIASVGSGDAFVIALDSTSGAAKTSFGIFSSGIQSGIQTLGGTGDDGGFGIALSGSTLFVAGTVQSTDAGLGGAGGFDGTGFNGFLLPLDASTGQIPNVPQITSPLPVAGITGTAFNYQITATNSPTGFNATNLPGGLTVNNGLISGTLPAVGMYNINLSASNASGTGFATLVLYVINNAVANSYPPIVQGGDNGVLGVAVDAAGNRYVCGSFMGALDFEPGLGADPKASASNYDAFITSYDPNGLYRWTQTFGGSGDDVAYAITVSPDGLTVYATGDFFGGNAKIGNAGFSVNSASPGFNDVFVLALNSATGAPKPGFGLGASGIQTFGGANNDTARAIAVSSNGSAVYVTGFFASTDARVGGSGPQLAANGAFRDAFVIALDSGSGSAKTSFGLASSGVQTFGGVGDDRGTGIGVLGTTVYVTGLFDSIPARIGNAGPGVSPPSALFDSFVIALDDTTGAPRTAFGILSSGIQTFGGTGFDNATSLAAAGSSVYISGVSSSSDARVGGAGSSVASNSSLFIVALDSTSGAAKTSFGLSSSGVQLFGGSTTGIAANTAIATNGTAVYATGIFTGTDATIGRTGVQVASIAGGGDDSFIIALDAATGAAKTSFGILSSGIQTFAGTSSDFGLCIAADGGMVFAGGATQSTNAGLGGTGPFSGAGFKGFLLPLDGNTGTLGQPPPTNNAPAGIALSNSTIPDKTLTGTPIGVFSTTDPDAGNTFAYALVAGVGSDDNLFFQIAGDTLQPAADIDFNAKNQFTIRVRSTDQGSLFFEKIFILNVTPSNAAPSILSLTNDQDPALVNTVVNYALAATDPDSPTLTYHVDFGDGTPPQFSTFPSNSTVTFVHIYTIGGDFTITATVNDGIAISAPFTLLQHVPPPASGGTGVINVSDNADPVVNPTNGLSIQVMASNGGVIQLGIDIDSFTLARANELFDVTTEFGDIAGQSTTVTGLRPVHQYIKHGIFVAKATATRKDNGQPAGIGRKTLVIGAKETGEQLQPGRVPPDPTRAIGNAPNSAITTKALKGKFIFNGGKNDSVSYSGTILMPPGLDTSLPHELSVGIGNIVTNSMVDARGRGLVPGNPAILKKLKISYLKVKRGTITKGGETAKVDLLFNTAGMVAAGFNTEGIVSTATGATSRNPLPRKIQLALLLDGVPYEAAAPVLFSITSKNTIGQITGRR